MWNKTIIDIMSDMLQVEIGDYIFLWVCGKTEKSRIYGVYRAVSNPYYNYISNEMDPFKVKIDIAYGFKLLIDEYQIINNPQMKNFLWTIIGKKVAGKSRGSTPITKIEMEFLIRMLIDKNGNLYKYYPNYKQINVVNELTINLKGEYEQKLPNGLSKFNIKKLNHRTANEVHYEKSLEGILNELFRNKQEKVISQLDIKMNNVVWYANYLPYGIERSEIDYMVIESEDVTIESKIDIIELMKGKIDEDHIRRCLIYSKWVRDTITQGTNIVRPVLICGPTSTFNENSPKVQALVKCININEKETKVNKIEIYKYEIKNEKIQFEKIK